MWRLNRTDVAQIFASINLCVLLYVDENGKLIVFQFFLKRREKFSKRSKTDELVLKNFLKAPYRDSLFILNETPVSKITLFRTFS